MDSAPPAPPHPDDEFERPLTLRLTGTTRTSEATALFRSLPARRRVVLAGMTLGAALLLALLFLPVPLLHLAGIPIVSIGIVLAFRRLRSVTVLRSARGTCPRCGNATNLFVGFGGTPARFPVTTSCEVCSSNLALEEPIDPS